MQTFFGHSGYMVEPSKLRPFDLQKWFDIQGLWISQQHALFRSVTS